MKFISKETFIAMIIALVIGYAGGAFTSWAFLHKKPVIYVPSAIVHQKDSINAVLKAKNVELDKQFKTADSMKSISEVKYLTIKYNYEKLRKEVATYNSGSSNDLLNQLFPE